MAITSSLARYIQTLRHLRAGQWTYQFRHRLLPRSRPSTAPRPELRPPDQLLLEPVRKRAVLSAPLSITIFDQSVPVKDWSGTGLSDLQCYNLHYFDLCSARSSAPLFEELVLHWVEHNPPLSSVGWAAFPLSLRAVNWIKWHLRREPLPERALQSLCLQARVLSARPEYHLLGNHLLANGVALFHLGCFFAGDEGERWRQQGQQIIDHQVEEQILNDGGHFERSPMYQGLVLEQLLDCFNMARCFGVEVPSRWRSLMLSMLSWSSSLRHPDGGFPFFNDSTLGVSPEHNELVSYADRLGLRGGVELPPIRRSRLLAESGFAILHAGPFTVLGDVGSPGPSYQPGHSHAETLSFEASVGDKRFLCNSGVSTYARSSERLRQRGSAAHNCLVINDADSSDVWSSFRVGNRAQSRVLDYSSRPEARLKACHDGYAPIRHTRAFTLTKEQGLTVDDVLVHANQRAWPRGSTPGLRVAAYFHLHPAWTVSQEQEVLHCLHPDGTLVEVSADRGGFRVIESSYHEGFGKSVRRPCLVLDWPTASLRVSVRFRCLADETGPSLR